MNSVYFNNATVLAVDSIATLNEHFQHTTNHPDIGTIFFVSVAAFSDAESLYLLLLKPWRFVIKLNIPEKIDHLNSHRQ
jgi:hypothetical protein